MTAEAGIGTESLPMAPPSLSSRLNSPKWLIPGHGLSLLLLVPFVPLARVDQVRNRGRLCPDMERLGRLLKVPVRTRHSLMLAEMLCPGFNEESFHEVSGARDI